MTDEPEWGPWIEHDGKGCPCVGQYAHLVFDAGKPLERFCIVQGHPNHWFSHLPRLPDAYGKIIRYRIRKPRGMKILQSILENLPEEVDA